MKNWLQIPLVQIALCIDAYALASFYFGKFAMLWMSPLLAVGIRRPLIALASSLRHLSVAGFEWDLCTAFAKWINLLHLWYIFTKNKLSG